MKLFKHEPKPTNSHPIIDNMENLFQVFFRPPNKLWNNYSDSTPSVDIREAEDRYLLSVDLPGFDKDEIKIEVNNGVLMIEAEHHEEKDEEKDGKTVLQERYYGSYVRSFNVGDSVLLKDITAKFKNGVLNLSLPKSPTAQENSHSIKIEAL